MKKIIIASLLFIISSTYCFSGMKITDERIYNLHGHTIHEIDVDLNGDGEAQITVYYIDGYYYGYEWIYMAKQSILNNSITTIETMYDNNYLKIFINTNSEMNETTVDVYNLNGTLIERIYDGNFINEISKSIYLQSGLYLIVVSFDNTIYKTEKLLISN